MSKIAKLMQQAAAGNAGGPLNVEDVFSTYLYTGSGSTRTITNGIDLAGEGGLVWIKRRDDTRWHILVDSERGFSGDQGYILSTNALNAQFLGGGGVESFSSSGFNVDQLVEVNFLNEPYASWTFRKAPKFFDVVTYTGDGTNGRQIPHNLGSNIGMVVCKSVSGISTWAVKHKDRPSDEGQLNSANEFAGYGNFPTSFAGFTDSYFTVDAGASTNKIGDTFVAYLFAHNDGDGEFGPNGDADIIKFGYAHGEETVNLGFEPQFIMFKRANGFENWSIVDAQRAMNNVLEPNVAGAEANIGNLVQPSVTGFDFSGLGASNDYIYMAIKS